MGSGKTMVALAAMLMAVENGYQAALMAPTEILAQQHAIVLRRLLEPLGTGGRTVARQPDARKRSARCASGCWAGSPASPSAPTR